MGTKLAPLPRNLSLQLQLLMRGTRPRKLNLINQLKDAKQEEWVHTREKAMSHWLRSESKQNGTRRARKLTWPSHYLKCFHMLFLQLQLLPWHNLHLLHGKLNMYKHYIWKGSIVFFVCSLSLTFLGVWVTGFKHVCMCSEVQWTTGYKRLGSLSVVWELISFLSLLLTDLTGISCAG